MKLLFTPSAEEDLDHQIEYGLQKFGARVASQTRVRVMTYLENTIRNFPHSGFYDPDRDALETWIPATPFVAVYRVDKSQGAVVVLGIYHHAQDRSSFERDTED
jgi:plasmid stabilization system protein ParE